MYRISLDKKTDNQVYYKKLSNFEINFSLLAILHIYKNKLFYK